jgi:hypothetical protein
MGRAGTAKLARHLVWLMLAAEAYAVDERIGPMYGADADHRRASLGLVGLDISSYTARQTPSGECEGRRPAASRYPRHTFSPAEIPKKYRDCLRWAVIPVTLAASTGSEGPGVGGSCRVDSPVSIV